MQKFYSTMGWLCFTRSHIIKTNKKKLFFFLIKIWVKHPSLKSRLVYTHTHTTQSKQKQQIKDENKTVTFCEFNKKKKKKKKKCSKKIKEK